MRRINSLNSKFLVFCGSLLILFCAPPGNGQSAKTTTGKTPEERSARYFESIRKSPPQMLAFVLKLPKGGDLHSHLSGAIYAESYIDWAAKKELCVNQVTMILSAPSGAPCDQTSGQLSVTTALANPVLYRKLIDAWSMRYWQYSGQNGHDQFFDSFGKFGLVTRGQLGSMLAEVTSRAARGRVAYLELMLTPDEGKSSDIGKQVGWDGNFESTLNKLKANGIDGAVTIGIERLKAAEEEKNRILNCGTTRADPGCGVVIRYIAQVARGSALGQVFAQMVAGFALANDPNSKVVALNLVQPEDSLASMQNFNLHMEMLNFLRPQYPLAHISLHAGELAPGMVPPEGLTFHIRDSVIKGHAQRIGHGTDVMHEDDPYGLLKELVRRDVMVEICLTSSDQILGIKKEQHPLATYLEYGVPVALATDDEGVSRSEISREYLKAAEEHGLGYVQLKRMARTSLQYAFLPGASLWANSRTFTPVSACGRDISMTGETSAGCKQYLAGSEKANLQWKLEQDFRTFENQF